MSDVMTRGSVRKSAGGCDYASPVSDREEAAKELRAYNRPELAEATLHGMDPWEILAERATRGTWTVPPTL
jgi:hypothetical protein